MLNGLSLFSGIGGLDVALSQYVRPIAYCELDKYCQSILLSRQANGHLEHAPIWDDIRTFKCPILEGAIDIIYGGFPCQDISIAGHGKGLAGKRSGLFWEIVRLAKEIKPKFIFLENVPAILTRGGGTVVQAITEMGYDCRWCVISAASVGALHRRERWFLLAHSMRNGYSSGEEGNSSRECSLSREGTQEQTQGVRQTKRTGCLSSDVADSTSSQCSGLSSRKEKAQPPTRICGEYETVSEWQEAVSSICRITDGIPFRSHRIKSLGNAVVPRQAKEAFEVLIGLKQDDE